MKFFRAYVARKQKIPTYFIESTARDNVDARSDKPAKLPDELSEIQDSDLAVRQIAETLAKGKKPNLVVMVHGFNNPEPAVMRTYIAAALAVDRDQHIRDSDGLVCVGYRWPSEKMGMPWRGTWDAMPTLPGWIFNAGVVLAMIPFLIVYLAHDGSRGSIDAVWLARPPFLAHVVTLVGLTFAGLVLTAAVLRAIVYFRDNYRATNYGVPDLVQVIRAIDGELGKLRGSDQKNDVHLSFIGHRMGGFVVTNTIRVLSDVFATPTPELNSYGAQSAADADLDPRVGNIGHAFVLKRFVLASPDIPAETLLSNRGNFLASALSRFEEAYLFSNEGDEVLRQISTLANYFVFPTKSRNHGFRLGNLEILSSGFGLIRQQPEQDFMSLLRVGNLTVRELEEVLERARVNSEGTADAARRTIPLPNRFTYFDCTDYLDQDDPQKTDTRPLLTFSKWRKRNNPQAKLAWYSHLHLLLAYVVRQKPNVHGGYFEGMFSQELLYRLACLGYEQTIAAYGDEAALGKACAEKRIRALISPLLETRLAAKASVASRPMTEPAPTVS